MLVRFYVLEDTVDVSEGAKFQSFMIVRIQNLKELTFFAMTWLVKLSMP
jgi:hypothetical protein